MMAAITFTFFLNIFSSSSVTARLLFAWMRLMLIASSSLRTGKNNTAAKRKDVTPYQNVSICNSKKGTPDSGQKPVVTESLRIYGLTVTACQHQALLF